MSLLGNAAADATFAALNSYLFHFLVESPLLMVGWLVAGLFEY